MRPIKFRAWIKDEDDRWFMTYDLAFEEYEPVNHLLSSVKYLMQWTGLKDKNGKDIYKTDVVKFYNGNIYEVTFENGCFCCFGEPLGYDYDGDKLSLFDTTKYCEIIGNFYENPELLNAK